MTLVQFIDFLERKQDEGAQVVALEIINRDDSRIFSLSAMSHMDYSFGPESEMFGAVGLGFVKPANLLPDGSGYFSAIQLSGLVNVLQALIDDNEEPLNAQVKPVLMEDEHKVIVLDAAVVDAKVTKALFLRGMDVDKLAQDHDTLLGYKAWHIDAFPIGDFEDYMKGLASHFDVLSKILRVKDGNNGKEQR